MSASTWGERPRKGRRPVETPPTARRGWINVDFSERRQTRRTDGLIPLLLIALVVALGVAALRIDLIRIRYAMATATESENRLIEERRALVARKQQLRDPVALAVEARARGFRSPDRSYSLPDPNLETLRPPTVTAGPPRKEASP